MYRSSIVHRLAAAVAAASLIAAGCGGDDEEAAGGSATEPASPTSPAGGGWIDGEPEWSGTASDASAEMAATEMMAIDAPAPATMAAEGAPGSQTAPLRAGSVDDNAAFDDYLAYLRRIAELGIPLRPYDPSGRVVVSVTGSNGLPVAGAAVEVAAGDSTVATLRTTADGTARFMPALYGQSADGTFTFSVGATSAEAAAGGTAELAVDTVGGADGAVALDVMFLLDATGSMGDEIDRLKTSIDSVAERVDALSGNPDVRFGMTLYRDVEDAFVTSTYDFTGDVAAFRAALADVVADGGGDYPEALDEGLAEALMAPAWRDPASTVQLVFLVADAPPQVGRQVPQAYPASIIDAIGRGIEIFPVASSESDDQAEAVFRQLAQATGGRFVFLSYGAAGASTGAGTDIVATDYEELALEDLVVRLIAEELSALTGDPAVVPELVPPSTTVPAGQ